MTRVTKVWLISYDLVANIQNFAWLTPHTIIYRYPTWLRMNSRKGAVCNLHEWEDPDHPCFTESYIKCIWSHDSVDFGWVKGEWSCVFVQLIHLFGFCWCQGLKILEIFNRPKWPISKMVKTDRSYFGLNFLLAQNSKLAGHFWPRIFENGPRKPDFEPLKCYNFALSIFRFVLAGCFSQWYWTQSKDYKYLRQQPLFLSFGFVLKNFGTLASGSIFMTVFVVSQARAPRTTRPNSARRELPWAVRWALDKAFMAFWKVKYEYDITAAELGAIMAFTIVFMCLKRNGLEWFSKISRIGKFFQNPWKYFEVLDDQFLYFMCHVWWKFIRDNQSS